MQTVFRESLPDNAWWKEAFHDLLQSRAAVDTATAVINICCGLTPSSNKEPHSQGGKENQKSEREETYGLR